MPHDLRPIVVRKQNERASNTKTRKHKMLIIMGIGMGMGMGMRMGPLDDEDQGEGRESQPDEPPQGIIIIFNSSQEVAVAASSFRGCCLICLCSLQEKSGEE